MYVGIQSIWGFRWLLITLLNHIISKGYLLWVSLLSPNITILYVPYLLRICCLYFLSLKNILWCICLHNLFLYHWGSLSDWTVFFCVRIHNFLSLVTIKGTTIVKLLILGISSKVHLIIHKFILRYRVLPRKYWLICHSLSFHWLWLLLLVSLS